MHCSFLDQLKRQDSVWHSSLWKIKRQKKNSMQIVARRPKTLPWLLHELLTENMAGASAYPDWEAMASTSEPLEEDWERKFQTTRWFFQLRLPPVSRVHFEAQLLDRQLSHFNRRCCISWELREIWLREGRLQSFWGTNHCAEQRRHHYNIQVKTEASGSVPNLQILVTISPSSEESKT